MNQILDAHPIAGRLAIVGILILYGLVEKHIFGRPRLAYLTWTIAALGLGSYFISIFFPGVK